jgi:hypothetical protein
MGASQRASQTQRLVVMSYAGIGQIILFGGGDVGGGGGAFEPGLVCAKAMGSNDIAITLPWDLLLLAQSRRQIKPAIKRHKVDQTARRTKD